MAKVIRRRGKNRKARSRVRLAPRFILLAGCLLAFLAGMAWLRGALVERLVQVVLVQEGTVDRVMTAAALVARRETVVLAPADGTVRWLVEPGERVRAGETVAELVNPATLETAERDRAVLEAELAAMRAAQAPAREALDAGQAALLAAIEAAAGALRVAAGARDVAAVIRGETELRRLAGEYWALEQDEQDLAARLQALEERVRAQQDRVDAMTVRVASPVAGAVVRELDGLEQSLSPSQVTRLGTRALVAMTPRPAAAAGGEAVRAATPLFKVVDSLETYLCMALPAAEGEAIPGSLRVRFPGLGTWTVAARLHHRGERERNGLMLVVLRLTDPPGHLALTRSVEVELVADTYHGPVVPRRALLRRDGATGVLVVIRNAAEFRPVEVLGGDGRQVVVRGVAVGAEIVLNPWLVREGVQVR